MKKAGSMTGYANLKAVAGQFPVDFLSAEQQPLMESLKGNSGSMSLQMGETTLDKTKLSISYAYAGEGEPGKHLLDMLNTIYLLSK